MKSTLLQTVKCAAQFLAVVVMSVSTSAADRIEGRVEGGGGSIAQADVTLWLAGPGAPQKLAETKSKDDGSFDLTVGGEQDGAGVLYLIAKGGEHVPPELAVLLIVPR